MTNQQLIVFIRSLHKRLSIEIARVRAALPEGSARSEQQVYTGGGKAGAYSTPSTDPHRWSVQQSGEYVALVGLIDLLAELDEATEILSGGERRGQ
jgi:hypothetical protein